MPEPVTDLSVVIPFTSTCLHRVRAAEFVADWWADQFPNVAVFIGGEPSAGPWVKARHVTALINRVHTRFVAVADADVILEQPMWLAACMANIESWAVPHKWVVRYDEPSTDRMLRGLNPTTHEPPYIGFLGGGMTVLPVELYQRAPLDPRFEGWGQEDESWALALRCLTGDPWRGRAKLSHLWHPPQRRDSRRWGSEASRALAERYAAASDDCDAMRALLAEVT